MPLFLALPLAGCTSTHHVEDGGGTDLTAVEAHRASLLTERPDVSDWRRRVIYFVLVDRFRNGDPTNDALHGDPACNDPSDPHAYQGGDLDGLTGHLDYLEELGADAVWITPQYRGVPVRAGENCGFPGYWIDFVDPYVLETEPRFGTPEDLDALLDGLHARGMPLMLDMVVNHAGYEATLVDQHPDWFTDPNTCWTLGDPDIYCALAGLPDFDHRRPEVTAYLTDLHLAWLDRFPIDAIRMDTVKHVEPDVFAAWTAAMRDRQPGMYMVGELLDEYSFDRFDRYLDAGFDGLFNFPLRRALIDTFARGESVDVAAGRMAETLSRFGEDRAGAMVNLLDNHDVRRFLEEVPAGVPAAEVQGRYHLALTALLTLPGIPQVYQGDELGMYGGSDPYNRRFMPDWAFDPAGRGGPHEGFVQAPDQVFDHVQQLLFVRQRVPALQTGSYRELWRQNGPQNNNVWAYLRQVEGSSAVVVHNNGLYATDGAVPLGVGGTFADGVRFEDLLGQAGVGALEVRGGVLSVALPGRSSVILAPDTEPDPLDTAEVRFEVSADTVWGERIYLTGDDPRLGAWVLDDALGMAPSDCAGTRCRWATDVVLPIGHAVQFKFVRIDEALAVDWEQGANRQLTVTADSEVVATFR